MHTIISDFTISVCLYLSLPQLPKVLIRCGNIDRLLRGDFNTQPANDRQFRLVTRGCHCLEQQQPTGIGQNHHLTSGWVLKSPVTIQQCFIHLNHGESHTLPFHLPPPPHPNYLFVSLFTWSTHSMQDHWQVSDTATLHPSQPWWVRYPVSPSPSPSPPQLFVCFFVYLKYSSGAG